MVYLAEENNRLVISYYGEKVWLEAWGANGLRVRGTKEDHMPQKEWALLSDRQKKADVSIGEEDAEITNGKITAKVNTYGRVTFVNNVTGRCC